MRRKKEKIKNTNLFIRISLEFDKEETAFNLAQLSCLCQSSF